MWFLASLDDLIIINFFRFVICNFHHSRLIQSTLRVHWWWVFFPRNIILSPLVVLLRLLYVSYLNETFAFLVFQSSLSPFSTQFLSNVLILPFLIQNSNLFLLILFHRPPSLLSLAFNSMQPINLGIYKMSSYSSISARLHTQRNAICIAFSISLTINLNLYLPFKDIVKKH